jgi:hypothetical protein
VFSEKRLVVFELRLSLVEGRLIGARIDEEERVALLHNLPR